MCKAIALVAQYTFKGYASIMKPLHLNILVSIIFISFSANAELYKGIDDEGNIIYSDQPLHNSEKFNPPSLTIIDAHKVEKKEDISEPVIEEKPAEFKYKTFRIEAPINDETIWNQPQLMVELQIKPALNTIKGHNIWLMMDGKPLVKNSKNTSLPIGRADRGSHTLQAQIKNKKGSVIKNTKTITVHIKHAVITKKPLVKQ